MKGLCDGILESEMNGGIGEREGKWRFVSVCVGVGEVAPWVGHGAGWSSPRSGVVGV